MTKRGTTLKRKSAAPQGRGALTMELSLASAGCIATMGALTRPLFI